MEVRNSGIELLRILSMLIIVGSHYAVHSGFTDSHIIMNNIFLKILPLGGEGVNLFVLITGYFMVKSSIKLESIVKLIILTTCYSMLFMLIFNFPNINMKLIMTSLFSFLFGYWFITTYLLLYLFIPFLNYFIKTINEEMHLKIIILLVIILSIFPTFFSIVLCWSPLAWFITLYLIAAYIRLYPRIKFNDITLNLKIVLGMYLFFVSSVVILYLLGYGKSATHFAGLQQFPILISSVSLFLIFKNLQIGYRKWINKIAQSMFGVYLIHEDTFIRTFIWQTYFKNNLYINDEYLILYAIYTITAVFFICILIDQIRIFFSNICASALEKCLENICKIIRKINIKTNISIQAWINGNKLHNNNIK